jgi:hypothetical protein
MAGSYLELQIALDFVSTLNICVVRSAHGKRWLVELRECSTGHV